MGLFERCRIKELREELDDLKKQVADLRNGVDAKSDKIAEPPKPKEPEPVKLTVVNEPPPPPPFDPVVELEDDGAMFRSTVSGQDKDPDQVEITNVKPSEPAKGFENVTVIDRSEIVVSDPEQPSSEQQPPRQKRKYTRKYTKRKKARKKPRLEEGVGPSAYEMRKAGGKWPDIYQSLGTTGAYTSAKTWALKNKLPWPPPVSSEGLDPVEEDSEAQSSPPPASPDNGGESPEPSPTDG